MIGKDEDPFDFLSDPHLERRVDSTMREEAALTILQFGIQTECLDQTILQAITIADNYLRVNTNI